MSKVLIVDDSIMSRNLLKNLLLEAGHNVVGEAVDGEKGFKMYLELKPDVVTMDITMPNMNGIDSLKKIIKHDPRAKVIMITALGQANKILEALSNGAKNYVTKPFESKKVLTAINEVLEEAGYFV